MTRAPGCCHDIGFLDLVSAARRDDVAARIQVQRTPARRIVVEREAGDVWFVLAGSGQVTICSPGGREVSVAMVGPGDVFGEIAALDGSADVAVLEAVDDLQLARMTRADFTAIVESEPAVALWLARRLAGSVRRLTDRIYELSALNVPARIQCELLRLSRTGAPVDDAIRVSPAPTHHQIASRIGTHREAVTRELRALADQRIVRTGRRTIDFIDLPRLERAVAQVAV